MNVLLDEAGAACEWGWLAAVPSEALYMLLDAGLTLRGRKVLAELRRRGKELDSDGGTW